MKLARATSYQNNIKNTSRFRNLLECESSTLTMASVLRLMPDLLEAARYPYNHPIASPSTIHQLHQPSSLYDEVDPVDARHRWCSVVYIHILLTDGTVELIRISSEQHETRSGRNLS